LSIDIGNIRGILEGKGSRCDDEKNALDERLEVLLGDLDNLDRIMGLTLSNKYYIAKKL
jgi:hypothetical protein